MQNNKITSLTIVGFVVGGIIGAVATSQQSELLVVAAVGGAIGFLAGWVWDSRSGKTER